MSEFKTINVWDYSREGFDRLGKKYRMQKADLFDHMVRYFLEGNVSPMDKPGDMGRKLDQMEKNVLKHIRSIIGFLRVQENEVILPVIEDSNRLVGELNELMKNSVLKEKMAGEEDLEKVKFVEEDYKDRIHFLKDHLEKLLNRVKVKKSLSGSSKLELDGMGIGEIQRIKEAIEKIK